MLQPLWKNTLFSDMDFNYFRKYQYNSPDELTALPEYDCLISSFIDIDRVKNPASKIPCKQQIWVCDEDPLPACLVGKPVYHISKDADGGIAAALCKAGVKRLCLDITGFVVPQFLLLLRYLYAAGFTEMDVIYTEPNKYRENENTQFSERFAKVEQVVGYSGTYTSEMENDLLIIAAGYDHSRIIDVANYKKSAKKVLLFGFPSSSPGMFQENIIRAYQAEAAVGSDCFKDMDLNIFAPANDPFSTAQALKEYIEKASKRRPVSNIYLAPLSSKPQALGIALYYIWEKGLERPISIIYPFCERYIGDTATGIARVWRYEIELPR